MLGYSMVKLSVKRSNLTGFRGFLASVCWDHIQQDKHPFLACFSENNPKTCGPKRALTPRTFLRGSNNFFVFLNPH